jgi:hypothetical protein
MRCWLKFIPLLPLLASGCVTHKLWTESRLDAWNEPAPQPQLRLFRAAPQNNFLVVYDELAGRNDDLRPRAFFLNPDLSSPAQGSHPHFVNPNSARGLAPVPVFFSAPTNPPEFFCTATNDDGFTIFAVGQPPRSFALPVYDDGWGRIEKMAWTPVAVVADLTIIGGYLGCVWIYSGGPGLGR